jgi:hypothetical protein
MLAGRRATILDASVQRWSLKWLQRCSAQGPARRSTSVTGMVSGISCATESSSTGWGSSDTRALPSRVPDHPDDRAGILVRLGTRAI